MHPVHFFPLFPVVTGGTYPGCQRFLFSSEAAIVNGEAAIKIQARVEKKTLWTQHLQTSLICDFETNYLTKPVILRDQFLFLLLTCLHMAELHSTKLITR